MKLENEILKAVELGVHNKHPKFTISKGRSASGVCSHRKSKGKYKTVEMSVPTDADSIGRVIRWHELMHSIHSASTPHCGSVSANTTEDIIIHLTGLIDKNFTDKFGHLYRDMVCVAIGDINGNICSQLRTENPIRKLILENTPHAPFYRSVFLRGFSLLLLVRPMEGCGFHKLRHLSDMITEKVIKLAEEKPDTYEFWAGFESNLHNQGRSICEYDSFISHSCWTNEPMRCFTNQIIALSKRIAVAVDRKQTRSANRHHALLLALVKAFVDNPTEEKKVGSLGKKIPKGMFASSTDRKVKYVENDLTHKCCTSMAPYASPSSTGSGINPSRLTKAVFGYPSVFTRRKQANKPPAAIMLDMSGSMSWSASQLEQMCAILPSADVFIYSDRARRGGGACDGTIERIASKGKRVGKMPKVGGGNGCDLQAMEKLLSFKGNVVLVSDLGFCGQGSDAYALAMKLVDENKGKRLTTCESSEAAIEFFKERSKKGW